MAILAKAQVIEGLHHIQASYADIIVINYIPIYTLTETLKKNPQNEANPNTKIKIKPEKFQDQIHNSNKEKPRPLLQHYILPTPPHTFS